MLNPMKIGKSHEMIAALVSQRLYYWHQQINGHATGTDSLEVPTIYFCPIFQGISPQNNQHMA